MMQVDAGSILWYVLQKGKKRKKGYKYRVPPYGRDETLGRVSNSFFLVFVLCAWRKQRLSLLWVVGGRYML